MRLTERERKRRWVEVTGFERAERVRLGTLAPSRRLITWQRAEEWVADETSLLLRRAKRMSFDAGGRRHFVEHDDPALIEAWIAACGQAILDPDHEKQERACEVRAFCEGCFGKVPELCECRDNNRNCFLIRFQDDAQVVMAKLAYPDAFRSLLNLNNE